MKGDSVITIDISEDISLLKVLDMNKLNDNVPPEDHYCLDTEEHEDEYYANTFLYTIVRTALKDVSGIEWSINANKCNVYQRHIEVVKEKYMSYFKEWLNSIYKKDKKYELTTSYDPQRKVINVFLKEREKTQDDLDLEEGE